MAVANGSHSLTAIAWDKAGNRRVSAVVSVTVANGLATQSPFTGTPFAVPGQFAAENFDKGGEGIAYHDAVRGNAGGLYRTTEDVDIISPYAGGYVVNNFQTGEWLEYTINVGTAGTYRIEALVSSTYTTSRFHVEIDGIDKTGAIGIASTGAWSTFRWVGKAGVSLSAGRHILRIKGDIEYFNLDAIRIVQ
jgi:carbohydrate binding protein with CBM6 domain